MLTTLGRNEGLDGLGLDRVALCTAFPGQNIANEVVGGTYSRQAITFGAAGAPTPGVRTSTGAVPFTGLPANVTIAWINFLKNAGAVSEAVSPNGANPKEFQVSTLVANSIYLPAHGYTAGQQIVFYGSSTVPTGLTEGTTYVVCTAGGAGFTVDNFQVAQVATPAVAIVIGTTQAGASCVVSVITPEPFVAAGGTFTLAVGATVNLNF